MKQGSSAAADGSCYGQLTCEQSTTTGWLEPSEPLEKYVGGIGRNLGAMTKIVLMENWCEESVEGRCWFRTISSKSIISSHHICGHLFSLYTQSIFLELSWDLSLNQRKSLFCEMFYYCRAKDNVHICSKFDDKFLLHYVHMLWTKVDVWSDCWFW